MRITGSGDELAGIAILTYLLASISASVGRAVLRAQSDGRGPRGSTPGIPAGPAPARASLTVPEYVAILACVLALVALFALLNALL